MAKVKILVVDDNEAIRFSLGKVLEHHGFDVTLARHVPEALKYISSERFDVLLSDLHMPGAGDGLTLVSAMRHSNPQAITMLLSGFPDIDAAAQAILLQADEVLAKPIEVRSLIELIHERLASPAARPRVAVESVATVLERSTESTIDAWFKKVMLDKKLMTVQMSEQSRRGHLPQLFRELVLRLRSPTPLGANAPNVSTSAILHGQTRRKQGYTSVMLVEESRMLQVSIFQTLQDNLASMDFSVLLIGVMTIADEVDAQLSTAMESYHGASQGEALSAA